MKVLCMHAHFDDFEFVAAGMFARLKQARGEEVETKLIVCTDGKAGHHSRTREETGRIRLREQQDSAAIGGYEMDVLRLPSGAVPREGCLDVNRELLAAFWKAIRDFEPDYLLCPPLASDPLAGIHVDHVAVAEAVRKVAYLINVPHAFTPEYPADETVSAPCKVPVILNVYDDYQGGANRCDFVVDIEPVFPLVAQMSFCHQSQIAEWLPWVGRHGLSAPRSMVEWEKTLRERVEGNKRVLCLDTPGAVEAFTVTAWGEIATAARLIEDIPGILPGISPWRNVKRGDAL